MPDFLILFAWLAAALGLGAAVLKLARHHTTPTRSLHLVTSAALGLGIISLTTLSLGLLGFLTPLTAWTTVLLGLVACAFARDTLFPAKTSPPVIAQEAELRKSKLQSGEAQADMRPIQLEYRSAATNLASANRNYPWLLLPCLPALSLACLAALVPPGLLWGDEPNGYDVLEYHLQIPREWYQLGRIVPLPHNVFSYFPFNVEMHYLLAMALRNGPWSGMYLAQLMHVAFIALTVFAIYALIAPRSKRIAMVAATAVATVPWMGLLAPIAYNEGGLLLWGTLAIGLSLRAPGDCRSMVLAGAMAGFACGTKLTAVPIVLLAAPLAHVAIARFKPAALVGAAAYLLAGCLLFSPWLIRNIAWVGNPVFPEEAALFGHGDWTPTQVQRWIRANHLPRPDQQNLPGRAAAAWNQILSDWRFGYALLPLALLAAALTRKNAQTQSLLLILLALSIFWLFFTHLQSRFFTLAIPLCALLFAYLPTRRASIIGYTTIILLMALLNLSALFSKLTITNTDRYAGHLFDFIGLEDLTGLTPLADATIAPDTKVCLIGDARAFLYNIPTARLFYKTVFDVNAADSQTSDQAWQSGWDSRAAPTIHVIDAPELRRFARTYFGIPLPSPGVMQTDGVSVEHDDK